MAQYEIDADYAPIDIVDAADGSGTTWPEFVEHVGKMDNQVAALTEASQSKVQSGLATIVNLAAGASMNKHPVAFEREFSSPPNVVATLAAGMSQSAATSFTLQVLNVTESGFEIWAGCNTALSSVKIYWIAVE